MAKRVGVPSREKIAEQWDGWPADQCWACEHPTLRVEKCHILAHSMSGSDDDPGNYVLLCHDCHLAAPDVGDVDEMFRFINSRQTQWEWLNDTLDEFPLAIGHTELLRLYVPMIMSERVPNWSMHRLRERRWAMRAAIEAIHNQQAELLRDTEQAS